MDKNTQQNKNQREPGLEEVVKFVCFRKYVLRVVVASAGRDRDEGDEHDFVHLEAEGRRDPELGADDAGDDAQEGESPGALVDGVDLGEVQEVGVVPGERCLLFEVREEEEEDALAHDERGGELVDADDAAEGDRDDAGADRVAAVVEHHAQRRRGPDLARLLPVAVVADLLTLAY